MIVIHGLEGILFCFHRRDVEVGVIVCGCHGRGEHEKKERGESKDVGDHCKGALSEAFSCLYFVSATISVKPGDLAAILSCERIDHGLCKPMLLGPSLLVKQFSACE